MPFNRLFSEISDINVYPANEIAEGKGDQLSLGDMHANALKLLYILKLYGFFKMSKRDYDSFVRVYYKRNEHITREHLDKFNQTLKGIAVEERGKILFIGDLLGDRGSNDYFVLTVLDRLVQGKVVFEIVLSNHDFEFIMAYETRKDFLPSCMPAGPFTNSLLALNDLVNKNIISREEIDNLINTVYKPRLKLLSYALDPTHYAITLYSHAPIGINDIPALARKLGVDYQDQTPLKLAETIENINAVFTQEYVNKNRVHELMSNAFMGKIKRHSECDEEKPLEHLMYNRKYKYLSREEVYRGYKIYYVHGHDSKGKTAGNVYNLENNFGKDRRLPRAEHTALYTRGKTLFELTSEEGARLSEAQDFEEEVDNHRSPLSLMLSDLFNVFGGLLLGAPSVVNSLQQAVFQEEEKEDEARDSLKKITPAWDAHRLPPRSPRRPNDLPKKQEHFQASNFHRHKRNLPG